jgi:hypothetical protein
MRVRRRAGAAAAPRGRAGNASAPHKTLHQTNRCARALTGKGEQELRESLDKASNNFSVLEVVVKYNRLDILENGTCPQILDKKWCALTQTLNPKP